MNFLKRLVQTSFVIITYPIFRGIAGDNYEGKGFISDVKDSWRFR